MMVYADNAATTRVSQTALDAMLPYFTKFYGNPSSLYSFAQEAKEALDEARETVAKMIGAASAKEIYFTSGGSEADNQAILSAARNGARKGKKPIDEVTAVITREELVALTKYVSGIKIDDAIYEYIGALVTETRKHPALSLGASPRASVALMNLAQAYAVIEGRDYVLPDDVAAVFRSSIAHRLILRQEAKLNGTTVNAVLSEILRVVPVPYKGQR